MNPTLDQLPPFQFLCPSLYLIGNETVNCTPGSLAQLV